MNFFDTFSFNKGNHSIVIWSEDKTYWETFAPIVAYFQKNKIDFIYLASDNDDNGLNQCQQSLYVGNNWASFKFLNNIKADIMIMTTPGLGDTAIKRSKKVKHYCHIVHAPTDVLNYQRCAFECFDSVFCSSQTQINNIRKLEKIRSTQKKQLFKTGCLYYDEKIKNKSNIKTDSNTILYAPAWGKISSLKYAHNIIDNLLSANYNVIIRPHPQSIKSDKKIIDDLKSKYNGKIQWDIGSDGNKVFAKSKLMISDISGVIFDFAFIYNKPVITIDYPLDYTGKENEKLNLPLWEQTARKNIGQVINLSDIDKITKTIKKINKIKISNKYINDNIFYFAKAGNIAGKQIMDILKGLK